MQNGGLSRRDWMAFAARVIAASSLPCPALALPPRTLVFPRDHGSHPEWQTEWWYITGHAQSKGRQLGFQVTFFRSRVASTQEMRSAFAAKQLIFAHAAVTDIEGRVQHHDQRAWRGRQPRGGTLGVCRQREQRQEGEGPAAHHRSLVRVESISSEAVMTREFIS